MTEGTFPWAIAEAAVPSPEGAGGRFAATVQPPRWMPPVAGGRTRKVDGPPVQSGRRSRTCVDVDGCRHLNVRRTFSLRVPGSIPGALTHEEAVFQLFWKAAFYFGHTRGIPRRRKSASRAEM